MKRLALLPLALLSLLACSDEGAAPSQGGGALEAYLAPTAVSGAVTVLEARGAAQPGQELVVRGRVKDFVADRAAFTLIDPSLRACSDEGDPMQDTCETPWDYCCIPPNERAAACATVEFRDATGVIKEAVQGFHGLNHLDTVIVKGKVEKDPSGNMTLVAQSFSFSPNTSGKH